jgi:hypothetical protein
MKNATDLIIELVATKGLPVRVSSLGRIGEGRTFTIGDSGEPVIASEEALKADFHVSNDDEPAYTDVESLKSVIKALINGEFSDEHLSVVDPDGSERLVMVEIGDEPRTTSLNYELLVSPEELLGHLEKLGVEIGIDDLEDELPNVCMNHGEEESGEKVLTSDCGVAVVEFTDGSKISFKNDGGLIVASSMSNQG